MALLLSGLPARGAYALHDCLRGQFGSLDDRHDRRNIRSAARTIAGGEHLGMGGRSSLAILGNAAVPPLESERLEKAHPPLLTRGLDDHVAFEHELSAGDGFGPRPALCVGLTQPH